tara:strand:+ start:1641 stop:1883 length:243 start_codon:yes stop_codon:yes gene_type:complete
MKKIILLFAFVIFFYGCKSSMKFPSTSPVKEKNTVSQVQSVDSSNPEEFVEYKTVDPIYAILGIVGATLFVCVLLRNKND